MELLSNFDLFLFDFDGLLVDTEALHLEAYRRMCSGYGITLAWSLSRFFAVAHASPLGIKEALSQEYPELFALHPNWEVLYAEKKRAFEALVQEGALRLMPGAEELIQKLAARGARLAVATHSPRAAVSQIRKRLPALEAIPHWITREDYREPKPAPDAYLEAIRRAGKRGDRIIGFEDSMRGLRALIGANVTQPVLVCAYDHPQMSAPLEAGVWHAPSLTAIQV